MVTHTGGKGGDYIKVPDAFACWDPYWGITIAALDESWSIGIWSNQDAGTLLLQLVGGNITVGWAPY